jgi:hypothetical protein
MTRVQRVNPAKKRLTASGLKSAFPTDVGGGTRRLIADFSHVAGLAAVRERGVTVALRYAELATLLGAVPSVHLGAEDMAVFTRVLILLRQLDGQPDPARETAVQGGDGDLGLLIASGLSPEKAAAARAAADAQAADEDQTRPQWAVAPETARGSALRGDSGPDEAERFGAELRRGLREGHPLIRRDGDLIARLARLYAVLISSGLVSGFDLGIPFSTGYTAGEIERWLRDE